jgi:hypothetical protein
MKSRVLPSLVLSALSAFPILAQPPQIGKVEILRSSELKPGMKGVAWTVFQGTEPESVPVEIQGGAYQRRRRDEWQPGLHRR